VQRRRHDELPSSVQEFAAGQRVQPQSLLAVDRQLDVPLDPTVLVAADGVPAGRRLEQRPRRRIPSPWKHCLLSTSSLTHYKRIWILIEELCFSML
jgi:hypothetical protein